jgi:hypothetical protein
MRNEATAPFENNQKVLGAMTQVAQAWSEAQDVMQYTQAKAKYEVTSATIQGRAAADPDFNNLNKYTDELKNSKKEIIKGISNQAVANKLGMEIDYGNEIASIKIGAGFREKEIANNKVMLKTNMDSLLQKKLNAATPAEAMQYDNEMNELLQANLKTGTIDAADLDKMMKDSQKTSVQYEIYSDPATKEVDSAVLKELKDPKGKYSFLGPNERLDLIQESQRRIFQNNQTFKREAEVSRNTRFDNIFTKAYQNNLTLADIDAEIKIPEEQGGDRKSVV